MALPVEQGLAPPLRGEGPEIFPIEPLAPEGAFLFIMDAGGGSEGETGSATKGRIILTIILVFLFLRGERIRTEHLQSSLYRPRGDRPVLVTVHVSFVFHVIVRDFVGPAVIFFITLLVIPNRGLVSAGTFQGRAVGRGGQNYLGNIFCARIQGGGGEPDTIPPRCPATWRVTFSADHTFEGLTVEVKIYLSVVARVGGLCLVDGLSHGGLQSLVVGCG